MICLQFIWENDSATIITGNSEKWWEKLHYNNFQKKQNVNSEVQKPTLMFAFFDTINHLSGPLRKQRFTSMNSNVMVCDM